MEYPLDIPSLACRLFRLFRSVCLTPTICLDRDSSCTGYRKANSYPLKTVSYPLQLSVENRPAFWNNHRGAFDGRHWPRRTPLGRGPSRASQDACRRHARSGRRGTPAEPSRGDAGCAAASGPIGRAPPMQRIPPTFVSCPVDPSSHAPPRTPARAPPQVSTVGNSQSSG